MKGFFERCLMDWWVVKEAFDPKPSKGTVQNDLLLMVKVGLTEKIGDGPSTKYKKR